ncbi:MAG: MarR family transcriptional regulator [Acidimicrobiales bacterium]
MDVELQRAVRTLALAGRGLERAVAPLTLPQYRILALVATAPERASRLAARVDVTKASLTGVLDVLEARGWIERADVAGDRRGVSLVLTGSGAAVLEAAEDAMGVWLADVLEAGADTTPAEGSRSAEIIAALCGLGEALRCHRDQRLAAGGPVGGVGGVVAAEAGSGPRLEGRP